MSATTDYILSEIEQGRNPYATTKAPKVKKPLPEFGSDFHDYTLEEVKAFYHKISPIMQHHARVFFPDVAA